jgi:hypothetical protein
MELGMESNIVQFWKMEAGRSLDQFLVEQQGSFFISVFTYIWLDGVLKLA